MNPNTDTVEGDRADASLADIAGGVDAVVIATRPDRAGGHRRGVRAARHRPGVDAPLVRRRERVRSATVAGREHGMTVIDGGCPLMFDPVADPGHKMMRLFLTATGKVPRRV